MIEDVVNVSLQVNGSRTDETFGDYANHDLAEYHVAVNADVTDIQARWLDDFDDDLNPMGSKGIGEIGIVGTAAAVANAVAHATGHRMRDLPIRPNKLLPALAARFDGVVECGAA